MKDSIKLLTKVGELEFEYFSHEGQEGIVVRKGTTASIQFVRVHSSCLFSEAFQSADCDCALQLNAALDYIGLNGGIVIYLYQEGRGLGLENKIKAISLQHSEGIDTATAFAKLGHRSDPRDYEAASKVLIALNVTDILLATNNPKKVKSLEQAGIKVTGRVNLEVDTTPLIDKYLREKQEVLGHYEIN